MESICRFKIRQLMSSSRYRIITYYIDYYLLAYIYISGVILHFVGKSKCNTSV